MQRGRWRLSSTWAAASLRTRGQRRRQTSQPTATPVASITRRLRQRNGLRWLPIDLFCGPVFRCSERFRKVLRPAREWSINNVSDKPPSGLVKAALDTGIVVASAPCLKTPFSDATPFPTFAVRIMGFLWSR